MSLEAVFAVLTGMVFGESMGPNKLLGCCLMFAAVLLCQLPEKKKKVRID
jgi:drug/metabolite transporter (DMT)-like permease